MDWKIIILDLVTSGLTQRTIALRVGCSQPLISALSSGERGKRLDYAIGVRIADLWRERCPAQKAAA